MHPSRITCALVHLLTLHPNDGLFKRLLGAVKPRPDAPRSPYRAASMSVTAACGLLGQVSPVAPHNLARSASVAVDQMRCTNQASSSARACGWP
jgi:hypothetical protein